MSAQDIVTGAAAVGSILVGGGTLLVSRRKTSAESEEIIVRAARELVKTQGDVVANLKADLDTVNARLDALTVDHARCQRELHELQRKVDTLERLDGHVNVTEPGGD